MGWCIRSLSWCAAGVLVLQQCESSRWTRPWVDPSHSCVSCYMIVPLVTRLCLLLHQCISSYTIMLLVARLCLLSHECVLCYTTVPLVARLCLLLHECVSFYTIVPLAAQLCLLHPWKERRWISNKRVLRLFQHWTLDAHRTFERINISYLKKNQIQSSFF